MLNKVITPNFNNWNANVDAIIEALQANGYQSRMEREGSSNKRHQLLGVGLYFVDSAEQYVIPCYNDEVFDLCPIVLREGKLVVTTKVVGRASSVGHAWFESWVVNGNGHFSFFMTTDERVAQMIRTIPPIIEPPVVELVPKDQAAAAAADAVVTTPAAATATPPAA